MSDQTITIPPRYGKIAALALMRDGSFVALEDGEPVEAGPFWASAPPPSRCGRLAAVLFERAKR